MPKNRVFQGAILSLSCAVALLMTSCGEETTGGDDNNNNNTPVTVDAELHFASDDYGTIYFNGTEYTPDSGTTIGSATVSVTSGNSYVFAAKVTNSSWGGGFLGLLKAGTLGDFATNGGWKIAYTEQTGWTDATFDDASWKNATAYGGWNDLVQSPCRTIPAEYMQDSCALRAFIGSQSAWLWAPKTLYFRKTVTGTAGTQARIRIGSDGRRTVYFNGTALVTDNYTPVSGAWKDTVTLTGNDVIAVTITDTSTANVGCYWLGDLHALASADTFAVSDASWKFNDELVSGWEGASFDDSQWGTAGAYFDARSRVGATNRELAATSAYWLWCPTTVYIRQKIDLQ